MITIFLDSSVDLKSLIGSYICSERIGEFEWKVKYKNVKNKKYNRLKLKIV